MFAVSASMTQALLVFSVRGLLLGLSGNVSIVLGWLLLCKLEATLRHETQSFVKSLIDGSKDPGISSIIMILPVLPIHTPDIPVTRIPAANVQS
jgi:hypothetical protein